MFKLITLNGNITGSARLNMQRSKTEICLNLRRRSSKLRAFVTNGKKVREVMLTGSCGSTERMDISGLILTDEMGNLLSIGNGGMSSKELEDFKISVRMNINAKRDARRQAISTDAQAASTPMLPALQKDSQDGHQKSNADKNRTSNGKGHANTERGDSFNISRVPNSPKTAEILNKASYLFHGEQLIDTDGQSSKHMDSSNQNNSIQNSYMQNSNTQNGYMQNSFAYSPSENEPKRRSQKDISAFIPREAVENPFPNFFDNSYWWRNEGETKRIYGTANVRGIKYNVLAVRSNAKYPPRGIGRSIRRLISSDGKRFWVGITKA